MKADKVSALEELIIQEKRNVPIKQPPNCMFSYYLGRKGTLTCGRRRGRLTQSKGQRHLPEEETPEMDVGVNEEKAGAGEIMWSRRNSMYKAL